MVTGNNNSEVEMFALHQFVHDLAYKMTDEFTTIIECLWSQKENLGYETQFWKAKGAFIAPKPIRRNIIPVNATSSSAAGVEYAANIVFADSGPYRGTITREFP